MIWKEDLKKVIAVALALVLILNVFQGNFWNAEAARDGDLTTVSGNETREEGSDTGVVVESIAEQVLESESEPDQFYAVDKSDNREDVTRASSAGEDQDRDVDLTAPEAETVESVEEILTDDDFEIAAEQAEEGDYADLTPYITEISATSKQEVIDFSYTDDGKLNVTLNFRLPSEDVKPIGTNYLYYLDLNEVFAKEQGSDAYKLIPALKDLNPAGESSKVQLAEEEDGGYFFINNGVIYFNFEESVERLKTSTIARDGWFVFECRLNEKAYQNAESTYELMFTHDGKVKNPEITVAEKPLYDMGLVVNKTAGEIKDDHTVQYTITVQNTGDSNVSGITLNDTLGQYLSLKAGSVSPAVATVNQSNNKEITFAVPEIAAGATQTITYTCEIADGAYITQNNVSGGTNGLENKISATYAEHSVDLGNGSKEKTSYDVKIHKDMVSKSHTMLSEDTVQWTITVNAGSDSFDLDGLQFTDGFTGDKTDIEVLTDSFDFQAADGKTVPADVQTGIKDAILSGMGYRFPEGTENLSFTLTYRTKMTPPEGAGTKTYTNQATVTNGKDTDSAWSTTGEIGKSLFEKEAVGFDPENPKFTKEADGDLIIHWRTTIHVPEGLTGNLIGTDRIYQGGGNELYFSDADGNRLDDLSPSLDIKLKGITLNGDAYTLMLDNPDPAEEQQEERSFTIEFNGDKLKEEGAEGKDITIDYYTVGDYAGKNVNAYYKIPYRNNFTLEYNDFNRTKSALVELAKTQEKEPGNFLSKSVESVDNKNHTITWKITIDPAAAGSTLENIVLEDTFDPAKMKFYGIDKEGVKDLFEESGQCYACVKEEESPWGVYKFRLEQAEAGKLTLNFDSDHLTKTWNFTAQAFPEISRKMSVYYTTQLQNDELGVQAQKSYKNTVTYTNNDDPDHPISLNDSAEAQVDIKILDKEGESAGDKGIKYTLTVNPQGDDLAKERDCLHVNDELPTNQILQTKSVTVTDGSGKVLQSTTDETQVGLGQGVYKLSYVGDIWQFVVPDQTPITITFYVKPLAASEEGTISYSNTVTIPQPYVESEISDSKNVDHHVASSAAGLIGQKFALEKVDAEDVTKKLEGAEFTATEWKYENDGWKLTGITYKGTTNAEGKMISSDFKASDGNAQMQYGNIYEIRETKAPAGYELTGKTYKFIVLNPGDINRADLLEKLPPDTVPINTGFTFLFSDVKKQVSRNELIIKKNYVAADGKPLAAADRPKEDEDKAQFALYKGNHTWAECENGIDAQYLCQEGSVNYFVYEYDRANDTITLQNIPAGNYTLYEKAAPEGFKRWSRVYNFNVDSDTQRITWEGNADGSAMVQAVTLENRKSIENRFEIQKTYLAPDGTALTGTKIPQAAVFYYRQTHTYNETGKTYVAVQNAQHKVISTTNSVSYALKNLEPGRYEITEETFDMYKPNGQLPYRLEVSPTGEIAVYKGTTAVTGDVIAGNQTAEVTVKVTNQVKENEIRVIKEYYQVTENGSEQLSVTEAKLEAETKFTLQKKAGNAWEDVSGKENLSVSNTGNTSSYRDWYILENLEPGEYRIRESVNTLVYEPQSPIYFFVTDDWSIRMRDETTGSYKQEIIVKNRKLKDTPARFYFTKEYVNHTGRVIEALTSNAGTESTFVYYKANNNHEPISESEKSIDYNSTTGRYEIEHLTVDVDEGDEQEYIIEEKTSPNSHKPIQGIHLVVRMRVNEDGAKSAYIASVECADQKDITLSDTEGEPDTITARLVNRPKENSIIVTKTYLKADGTTPDTNVPEKAEFTLQKYKGSGERADDANYTAVGAAKTASDDNKYEFKNLDPGEYRLVETRRPNGFTGCEPLAFEVNDNYEIVVDNTLPNDWEVTHMSESDDEDSHKVSVTAKNTRRTNKFILEKYYILSATNEVRWDGTGYDALKGKTTFVLQDESGADISTAAGFAYNETDHVWKVENLTEGTYTIEEADHPAGYQQAGSIRLVVKDGNITATYQGTDREHFTTVSKDNDGYQNATSKVKAELGNVKVQNKLTVTKIYREANGDRIPYNMVQGGYAKFTLKKVDGTEEDVTGKISDINRHSGKYEIKGLEPGTYELKEQKLAGFPQVEQGFTFIVDDDGKISCGDVSASDNPWTIDANNDNELDVQISIENQKSPNEFQLSKYFYDVNGNHITGKAETSLRDQVNFEIKGVNGTKDPAVDSYKWDNVNGIFSVENLRRGTYEIKETVVPSGYDAAVGTVRLVVDDTGYITAQYIPYPGAEETDFGWYPGYNNSNGTLDVRATLANHQLTNSLQINKQYISASGKEIDVSKYEAADLAKFELRKKNGESYEKFTGAGYVARSAEGIYQFKNIPAGTYKIVETAPDGYENAADIEFTVANDNKIVITQPKGPAAVGDTETSKTVKLTNQRKPIELKLTKLFYDVDGNKVSDADAKEAFKEVTFELRDAQGAPIGDVKKNSEDMTVIFTGISEDGEYTIVETGAGTDYQQAKAIHLTVSGEGVTASYGDDGDDGDADDFTFIAGTGADKFSAQMTLKNHEKEDSYLVITKTIKGEVTREEAEGALVFTVTDPEGNKTAYKLSEFTYDEQTKQYTLVLNVSAGIYEVEETITDINGYTLASVTNTVGTEKSDGAKATVTIGKHDTVTAMYEDVYTTDTGTLRITKTIKGNVTREEAEGALQFKVTENKSGEAKVYTLKDFTYDEASKVYTLELKQKAGGYTVEETVYNIAGYAVESVKYSVDGAAQQTGSKAEVKIGKDAVTTVAFEDNYTDQPGELIIIKTIKGDVTREEAEGALRFKVTNNDTGFVQEFTLKDFKYNKKTGVWTLKLPAAAGGYTVEETVSDVDGFDTVSVKYTVGDGKKKKGSSAQSQVESGQKTTVAFEDTYNKKKGKLRITKSVWGDVSREEAEESLVFTVTDNKTGKKTDYKLKDFKYDANRNQYYLELDLPNGSYTVEETNYTIPDHYLETNTVSVNGEKPWGSFTADAQVKVNKTTKVAFEDRYTSKLTSTALITKLTTTLTKTNLVKTGDEAPLGLWLLMLILSAGGIIAGVVLLRKKKDENAV